MKINTLILTIDTNLNFAIDLYKRNLLNSQNDLIFKNILASALVVSENYIYKNDKIIKLEKPLCSFHERVQHGLKHTDAEYILIMLDDFFITKITHSDKVIDILEEIQPSYLRLNNNPPIGKRIYGKYPFNATFSHERYQINTQPSIWKKNVAELVFDQRVTPWILETFYQFKYSSHLTTTLSVSQDILKTIEIIKKGKIKPITCRLYKIPSNGLDKISFFQEIFSTIKNIINYITFKLK